MLENGWNIVKERGRSVGVGVFSSGSVLCTQPETHNRSLAAEKKRRVDSLKLHRFFILITLHGPLR